MLEDNLVMVVRRVYRAGCNPCLAILMPEESQDEEGVLHQVFSYLELPFMEDVRQFYFPPLTTEKAKPSKEQLEAVDDLIDALLVKDDDKIDTRQKLNPYYQHLYQCVTFKALNPGRVLPKLRDFAAEIMDQPKDLEEKAKPVLEKISKLFKTEVIEKKRGKLTGEEVFGNFTMKGENEAKRPKLDLSLSSGPKVDKVGTVNPSEDFKNMLENGMPFASVLVQLEEVIFKFIAENYDEMLLSKAIKALKTYRETSLKEKNVRHFNQFMQDLKQTVKTMNRTKVWDLILEHNLGLISTTEEFNSNITSDEAKEFLNLESVPEEEVTEDNDEDLLADL